jgi:hypothetical protein
MSLFLRRRLQGYLDDLHGRVPPATIDRLVGGLNTKGIAPLGFEWEVLLLWGLSQEFTVEYETGHPNAPKLDFVVRRREDSSLFFTADVRCVSDLGRHKENPVEQWSHLLASAKIEAGLGGELSWQIEGDLEGPHRDAKMQLRLPRVKDSWETAERRIREFVGYCKKEFKPKTLDCPM